jgi:hypothetical protein
MSQKQVDISKLKSEDFIKDLKGMVQFMDSARAGNKDTVCTDISLEEMVQEKYGLSQADFFEKIGINPRMTTMQNIFTMPNEGVRWIVPEIIRAAIVAGIRQAPFYPELISHDEHVSGLKITMPHINMSDAAPAKVNEAETIPLGDISYGEKTVSIFKVGKGFKITDEVRDYVSLDVLGVYLRDFGIQLGYALDALAMDVLLNGNMLNGAESAPVVGVYDTTKGIQYKDLLRLWVRASRLGRNYQNIVGGENLAIDMLNLPEFKDRKSGTTDATLNIKSPVPSKANFYIHPGTPDQQLLMVDRSAALIKLTAKELMLESERIVSNQTQATYATLTTGFCKMYQDAAVLVAANKAFTTNGFPAFMNIDPFLHVGLE